MNTIAEKLLLGTPEQQGEAFNDAIALIREGDWNHDIGHGCNLFHFVAYVPEKMLTDNLPDWQDRIRAVISKPEMNFNKVNDASPRPKMKGPLEGEGIPVFNGDTPLGIALFQGNKTAAEIFLERANPNHINASGNSILHLAAASNILVEAISKTAILGILDGLTDTGQTPSDQARQHGHLETAAMLDMRHEDLRKLVMERWTNQSITQFDKRR